MKRVKDERIEERLNRFKVYISSYNDEVDRWFIAYIPSKINSSVERFRFDSTDDLLIWLKVKEKEKENQGIRNRLSNGVLLS